MRVVVRAWDKVANELLDELQELVSSEKINEIIEKLRSLDNE